MNNEIEFAHEIEKNPRNDLRLDACEDLLLLKYMQWRRQQEHVDLKDTGKKTREMATTISSDRPVFLSIDKSVSKWID